MNPNAQPEGPGRFGWFPTLRHLMSTPTRELVGRGAVIATEVAELADYVASDAIWREVEAGTFDGDVTEIENGLRKLLEARDRFLRVGYR